MMPDDRMTVIREIAEAYRQIFRSLHELTTPVWMELDLSMAQLKTLFVLCNDGAVPIGSVAEKLGVGLPTASHLIDRLVQAQLAVRTEDPDDRRRTLACLSPQGEELSERLRQSGWGQLQQRLARLDDATLAALHHGLCALQAVSIDEVAAP
jgi:DNA-binding MarR family transcriptional regulator